MKNFQVGQKNLNKQTNKQGCSHKSVQSGLAYIPVHIFINKCANPVVHLYAGMYYYNKHVDNQDSVAGR